MTGAAYILTRSSTEPNLGVCDSTDRYLKSAPLYPLLSHCHPTVFTVMENDLHCLRDRLLNSSAYAANVNFPDPFSWHSQRTGQILVKKKTKQNAVIAVVGRVLENRLHCSAQGNFGNREGEKLAKAKYHLLLGKPDKTVFATDFETALHKLHGLQNSIATWPERENFIVRDNQQTVLRFTRAIFEERRPAIRGMNISSSPPKTTSDTFESERDRQCHRPLACAFPLSGIPRRH